MCCLLGVFHFHSFFKMQQLCIESRSRKHKCLTKKYFNRNIFFNGVALHKVQYQQKEICNNFTSMKCFLLKLHILKVKVNLNTIIEGLKNKPFSQQFVDIGREHFRKISIKVVSENIFEFISHELMSRTVLYVQANGLENIAFITLVGIS